MFRGAVARCHLHHAYVQAATCRDRRRPPPSRLNAGAGCGLNPVRTLRGHRDEPGELEPQRRAIRQVGGSIACSPSSASSTMAPLFHDGECVPCADVLLALPEIGQSFKLATPLLVHPVRVALRRYTALELGTGKIPRPSDAHRFAACSVAAPDA